jgi:hypothetical protein
VRDAQPPRVHPLVEKLDRDAAHLFPNKQVGAKQSALVLPRREPPQQLNVERPILVVNRQGVVAAEIGPQLGSTARVAEPNPKRRDNRHRCTDEPSKRISAGGDQRHRHSSRSGGKATRTAGAVLALSDPGLEVSREGVGSRCRGPLVRAGVSGFRGRASRGRDVVVRRFGPRFRGFAAMGSDRDVVVGALRELDVDAEVAEARS